MAKKAETYAATSQDGLGIRFYFHAISQMDADEKMLGWNRYHGRRDTPGWDWHIAIKGDAPNSSWIHNEYVSY